VAVFSPPNRFLMFDHMVISFVEAKFIIHSGSVSDKSYKRQGLLQKFLGFGESCIFTE